MIFGCNKEIPHVKPEPIVRVEDGIERTAFIRENAAEFMSNLLSNIQVVSPEDMQALADECVKTAEYIWEHSKRVTR